MWADELLRRLRFFRRYKRFDRDLLEEMDFHLTMKTRDLTEQGMLPEEARYAARRKFGNERMLTEVSHEAWGWTWLENFVQDVRYGLRQFRKAPAFTIVAIATLALGIGLNTAIFSALNAITLRYLPVEQPRRLFSLATTSMTGMMTGHNSTSLTEPMFEAFRQRKDIFSDLVAYVPLSWSQVAVRAAGTESELVHGDMVSGNFFSGLGVPIALGRGFTVDDEKNHAQVVVLNYDYWKRRFEADPRAIGRTIFIKTIAFTVIGISEKRFSGVEWGSPTDLWVPFQVDPQLKPWGRGVKSEQGLYNSPHWWFLMMIGRLAPGVTPKQASARLAPQFQHQAYEGLPAPGAHDQRPRLLFSEVRGIAGLRQEFGHPLMGLMAMVAVVLLIACANVSMLLLARNSSREREFAVRIAMGGSRSRLLRQLLTESLMLLIAGSALGWMFAVVAVRALAAWAQIDFNLAPDGNVLLFTLAASTLAALLFGLVPLRSALRVSIGGTLKLAGSQATQERRKVRGSQIIVALQMSLCLALLVTSALLVRCLRNLQNVDLGFRSSGLLVFGLSPLNASHSDEETFTFYRSVLDALRALPGIESVTMLEERIGGGESNNTPAIVDGKNPRGHIPSQMRWNVVGPDFLSTLRIPLVIGRDFSDADSESSAHAIIVNQTFADRYLLGTTPIGHRVGLGNGEESQYTIVGVAADSKYTGVREDRKPIAYFPYTQTPGISTMNFELRSSLAPGILLPTIRRVIHEINPDSALINPVTQKEQWEQSYAQEHLFARLSFFFGLLAAMLVATGLYGTASYRVTQRSEEIGIRMALGAQRVQVLWMVLREALVIGVAGIAFGLPLSVAAARLLRSMLYGVASSDPVSFAGAFAGVIVIAIFASLIPALRAASSDPLAALRYE